MDRLRAFEPQEERLQTHVEQGIEKCEWQYGITREFDMERFIKVSLTISLNFDKDDLHAWTIAILRHPSRKGCAKMDQIEEQLIFGGTPA